MKTSNEFFDNEGNNIKILGLTGLAYSDSSNEKYLIDSELLTGKEYDIVIFQDKISFLEKEGNRIINEETKRKIMNVIFRLLQSNNIKPLVM